MTATKKSTSNKYLHIKMGYVILLWKMFNTPFLIIFYKLQAMKVFYSAPNTMLLYLQV